MASRIEGLGDLIHDFERIEAEIPATLEAVVKRGAQNIKTDWRHRWSRIQHAPRISRSISYDVEHDGAKVRAEIGPVDEPENQGFLGSIIEYGTSHNGPTPGGIPAVDAEAPRFERAMSDAIGDLIDKKA